MGRVVSKTDRAIVFSKKTAHSRMVLTVTELFNITVNDSDAKELLVVEGCWW